MRMLVTQQAMELARKFNRPFIITERMTANVFRQFLKRDNTLEDCVYQPLNRADKIIAVSPSLKQYISAFGIDRDHIVFIPNVVNEDFFTVEEQVVASAKFIYFTLCLMSPQKGIPILLKAVKRVIVTYPQRTF